MLRLLTAISVGVFVGGIALTVVVGNPDLFWIWTVGLVAAGLFGMSSTVGGSLRGVAPPRTAVIEAAASSGRLVSARIERIRRTGTMINNQPVCEMTLVVAPPDRDAYQTTAKAIVDVLALPRYQPGAVVSVVRHAADRPEVAVVTDDDSRWHALTRGAAVIPPASHAPTWAGDPNRPIGRGPTIPIGPSGRVGRIAVFVLCGALASAAVIAPSWGPFSRAATAILAGVDADDFSRGENAAEAVAAIVDVAGSPQFVEIIFYDGFVLAEAPTTPGAITVDDYQFRYGQASRTGPTLIPPDDLDAALFDVGEVDIAMLPQLFAKAQEATGLVGEDVHSIIVVSRAIIADDAGRRSIEITISLDDPYFSGSVTTDVTGVVIRMGSEVPGSPAHGADG